MNNALYSSPKKLLLSSKISLPQTPEVIAREKTVVICYSDGSEIIWGEEKTRKEAIKLARELEIELRAINYIKWHVRTFIKNMIKLLDSIGADEALLRSIISDGHSFAFNELDRVSSRVLVLDTRSDIKQAVLKKLEELYVV